MNEQWQELKETITELRDNDGTGTQQEICEFLANLMEVLEKQMKESKTESEEQPCEDCISREAVINVLKELMSDWDNDYNVPLIKTRGRVKDLPSVTPTAKYGKALKQTRWIPISKSLPEVNQRVLVTSYSRVCYAMMISADGNSGHPVFKLQDSLNEKVVCETAVHNKFTTSRITAWMPLPEPYKAESEDKE